MRNETFYWDGLIGQMKWTKRHVWFCNPCARAECKSARENCVRPPGVLLRATCCCNVHNANLLRDKLLAGIVIRATESFSSCKATKLRDKLQENVARITWP